MVANFADSRGRERNLCSRCDERRSALIFCCRSESKRSTMICLLPRSASIPTSGTAARRNSPHGTPLEMDALQRNQRPRLMSTCLAHGPNTDSRDCTPNILPVPDLGYSPEKLGWSRATAQRATGFNVGLQVGKNSNLGGNDFFNNAIGISVNCSSILVGNISAGNQNDVSVNGNSCVTFNNEPAL